ncbi:MAG: methylmalonyl Co-A mutase-associated GTPase MeaB, partial [Halobacteriaceae archaeon]
SAATTDAVKALDAFGKDKIIIETVGAGQNEIDIVKTADTIAVLVPPGSGDDIQMLKAGILEIADIFVVNKADLDGADKIVTELKEMVRQRDDTAATRDEFILSEDPDRPQWSPEILTTIANKDEGINDVIETIEKHQAFLTESGRKAEKRQVRYAEEIKTLLREDVNGLIASEIEAMGGIEELSEQVLTKETDPYTLADTIIEPLEECLRQQNQ